MEGLEQEQESEFDLNLMTKWFAKWKDSSPIDMGITTYNALIVADQFDPDYKKVMQNVSIGN